MRPQLAGNRIRSPRFNPRTPCGVRRGIGHRPGSLVAFQSTHSLRSATIRKSAKLKPLKVSIHALLAECDLVSFGIVNVPRGFNPRTPCGVRQLVDKVRKSDKVFQSTHSLRSATTYGAGLPAAQAVSIHALLAECDSMLMACKTFIRCFNPRTPCGVRPVLMRGLGKRACFNPRTPCGVRLFGGARPLHRNQFQSTHSLRSATQ